MGILSRALNSPAWHWSYVGWFAGGFVIWIFCFYAFPRPTWIYVFGHELTHAVATWLSGGTVSKFSVTELGGQVQTDRSSPFIALAPYILPLFPAVTGIIWIGMSWIWTDLLHYQQWFLLYWGLVWSFHITFTLSTLPTEQTDFSSQGYLFSYVIILLGNLWIITGLMWALTGVYGFQDGFRNYSGYCWHDYDVCTIWCIHAIRHLFMLFNRPIT